MMKRLSGIAQGLGGIRKSIRLTRKNFATLPVRNNVSRTKELMRIEQSNLQILKRLQHPKSDYSVEQMRADWKKNKRIIQNISEFPLIVASKPRTADSVVRQKHHSLQTSKI